MQTTWWKQRFVDPDHKIYPDNIWYREHDERNFDIVNLGSSAAKYAFQYDGLPIKAMNWAQQPQSLLDDFRILKNFHSILKKHGIVIITIMPFSSLNKEVGVDDVVRYVGTLDYSLLDSRYRDAAYAKALNPRSMGSTKKIVKQAAKYLLGKDRGKLKPFVATSAMNDMELEQNADAYMDGWAKQFDISDWEAPLSLKNQQGRAIRVDTLRKMVDFCKSRTYRVVLVIPPISPQLSSRFSEVSKDIYIYSFIREAAPDVELYDYMDDKRFAENRYYFDSLLLNQTGAKLFTQQVLKDLGVV